jgi:hypothetical protein
MVNTKVIYQFIYYSRKMTLVPRAPNGPGEGHAASNGPDGVCRRTIFFFEFPADKF